MELPSPDAAPRPRINRTLFYILIAGFVAGALDILAAFTYVHFSSHLGPGAVMRFISSGVFGIVHAFAGGHKMIVYGWIIHFAIAYFWTFIFFLAYPYLLRSLNVWVSAGIIGIVVWLLMNLVALPLSRVPHSKLTVVGTAGGVIILILAVGFPIAFFAKKANRSPHDHEPNR